jgi:hypothetical protein
MVVQHLLYHPKGKGLSLFIAATDTGKNYVVCKQVAKPTNQHAFIKVHYRISSRSMGVENSLHHFKVKGVSLVTTAGTGEKKTGYLDRYLKLQHQLWFIKDYLQNQQQKLVVEHSVYHPKVNWISLVTTAGKGEKTMEYLDRLLNLQHQHAFIISQLHNWQQEDGGRTLALSPQGQLNQSVCHGWHKGNDNVVFRQVSQAPTST